MWSGGDERMRKKKKYREGPTVEKDPKATWWQPEP